MLQGEACSVPSLLGYESPYSESFLPLALGQIFLYASLKKLSLPFYPTEPKNLSPHLAGIF